MTQNFMCDINRASTSFWNDFRLPLIRNTNTCRQRASFDHPFDFAQGMAQEARQTAGTLTFQKSRFNWINGKAPTVTCSPLLRSNKTNDPCQRISENQPKPLLQFVNTLYSHLFRNENVCWSKNATFFPPHVREQCSRKSILLILVRADREPV